jgi:hypothetical protein
LVQYKDFVNEERKQKFDPTQLSQMSDIFYPMLSEDFRKKRDRNLAEVIFLESLILGPCNVLHDNYKKMFSQMIMQKIIEM